MPAVKPINLSPDSKWTILKVFTSHRRAIAKCRCFCGTEKDVRAETLRNGKSLSCGCMARELQWTRYWSAVPDVRGVDEVGSNPTIAAAIARDKALAATWLIEHEHEIPKLVPDLSARFNFLPYDTNHEEDYGLHSWSPKNPYEEL